jgi:hypothetical protein
MSLLETVAEVLHAEMPIGIPDVFRRVILAEMDETGVITAVVVMFDGLPGRVRCGQLDFEGKPLWWTSWVSMGGGAVVFEDGKWVRVDHGGQPMPQLLKERVA